MVEQKALFHFRHEIEKSNLNHKILEKTETAKVLSIYFEKLALEP